MILINGPSRCQNLRPQRTWRAGCRDAGIRSGRPLACGGDLRAPHRHVSTAQSRRTTRLLPVPGEGIAARRATAGRPYVGRGPGERGLRIPVVMGSCPMPTALKSRGHSRPALEGRSRLPAGRRRPGHSRREHGEDPSHFLVHTEFLRQTPGGGALTQKKPVQKAPEPTESAGPFVV